MNHTAEVQQSLEEVQALLAHLETASWVEEDWGMLQRVLRSYARLLGTLFEAQMTLKRLQALLFGTRRRRRTSSASAASADAVGRGEEAGKGAGGGGNEASGADAGVALDEARSAAAGHAPRSGGHRPGSGRLGAEAYEGAERVECRHEALAVGERCPVCGQGRLYALPPGVEIRIDGNALLSAIRYEVEKLRCSACGQVFTATLPAEAAAETGCEAHSEVMQRTAEVHDEIADARLPQPEPVFHNAAALAAAVDRLDPPPTVVQGLVGPFLR